MSLLTREKRFDIISQRLKCERLARLVLVSQIEPELFHNFQIATMLYCSHSLPGKATILEENNLLKSLTINRTLIKNLTPNGAFRPKLELIPEFNLLYRTYVEIVKSLNIDDLIDQVVLTFNVRLKENESSNQNIGRSYASELIHSDAWVHEKAHGIHLIIPIFGDTEKNNVECFDPPDDFEESWLKPLPNFQAGADIARRYIKTNIRTSRKGYIYLFDYSVLHQTVIQPGAGPRISTNHAVFPYATAEETQNMEIEQQKVSFPEFCNIGKSKILVFPDSINDEIDHANNQPILLWKTVDI